MRGPLGSRQGEGTVTLVTHSRAFDIPSLPCTGSAPRPALPVPRCLWAAGAPSTHGSPTPSRAPRGGSQAGGPITRPRPLGQPSGLPFCVRARGSASPFPGPTGQELRNGDVPAFRFHLSVGTGHEGKAGRVPLLPLHLPVPRELTRYPQGDRSRCAHAHALSHCGHARRSSRRPFSGTWGPRQVLLLTPPPRSRSQVRCDAVHPRSSILDPGG